MLFPYAPVVNYVNHHSTRTNAKMRWSLHPSHDAGMLKMPPRELIDLERTGLMMDMVATRDIEIGEEIYLDYGMLALFRSGWSILRCPDTCSLVGAHWEQQWNEYVKKWKPDPEDEGYISASILNKRAEWLRTQHELKESPYPPNVFTGCFMPSSIHNIGKEMRRIEWRHVDGLLEDATNIDICNVVARHTKAEPIEIESERDSYNPPLVTYTVVIPGNQENPPITVVGVPRVAIVFLDSIYSNDQYNRDAFRHEIELPDEMVPDIWRDLKS
jgi:hypothetical protein